MGSGAAAAAVVGPGGALGVAVGECLVAAARPCRAAAATAVASASAQTAVPRSTSDDRRDEPCDVQARALDSSVCVRAACVWAARVESFVSFVIPLLTPAALPSSESG